jgi:16S rRNA (guanine527-N7)-methyltransferase
VSEGEARLERFLREIEGWGKRVNLVGSVARSELAVHVSDSLAAAAQVPRGASVVDLGSGAGFPGIPLAIARPDLRVTLVEAREKKAHFLRHAVRVLELAAEVRWERFEERAPASFDVVCVRAVGPAGKVLPAAAGWAGPEGEIWLWTRLGAEEAPVRPRAAVELGERGRILRFAASEFPRGTKVR